MPQNSMKQNITQVIAWMKANNFMKEDKRPAGRRPRRAQRKRNFK